MFPYILTHLGQSSDLDHQAPHTHHVQHEVIISPLRTDLLLIITYLLRYIKGRNWNIF